MGAGYRLRTVQSQQLRKFGAHPETGTWPHVHLRPKKQQHHEVEIAHECGTANGLDQRALTANEMVTLIFANRCNRFVLKLRVDAISPTVGASNSSRLQALNSFVTGEHDTFNDFGRRVVICH